MHENVTEKDIQFICGLHDPICIKESIYPANLKACHTWAEQDCELYRVRNYQRAWQPYNWLICDDRSLIEEKNLKKKILAGSCMNLGARDIGKSWDFIQADFPIHILHMPGKESCLISATSGFLKKVANTFINIYREHPFFKLLHKTGKKPGINSSENMEIQASTGAVWYGRNEKINDPEPGEKVQGLHYELLGYEEYSYATSKGEEKRVDSGTSIGEIERFSGIPDIRIDSPMGNIFNNEENKRFICRLPQFVRANWSEEQKEQRAEKYKGESSLAYKLNVVGEKQEGAFGFWDILKIKQACLVKSRKIKQFDIDEKKAKNLEHHLIIDRLPCQQIYVCADIGSGARPTEIIIIFYDGTHYKSIYNITVNIKSSQAQAKIFAYIYKKLGGAFIGIDATTDYGIVERLKNDYDFINPKHIYSIDLRKNIPIGFLKDDKTGKILRDKTGKRIIKQMIAIDFAMQQLEDLLYNGKVKIPLDTKFFAEFGDFLVIQGKLRRSYDTASNDDLHQAWQIFALTQWEYEWETLLNKNNADQGNGCLGVI